MVRNRPIGAVLVDICADLGIGVDHPLWQELRWVICDHNGQPEPVMQRTFKRVFDARQEIVLGLAPDPSVNPEPEQPRDTTDPPPLLRAA